MTRLTIADEGVIYRNPLPGHQALHVIYPSVAVLDADELVCVVRTGQALYSRESGFSLLRSTDGAHTWQLEGPVMEGAGPPEYYNCRTAALSRLRDGTLVLCFTRARQPDRERLVFNTETGGLLPAEDGYLLSDDGGRTWGEPVIADLGDAFADHLEPAICGGLVELADGTWLRAYETWKAYENDGPFELNSYGLFSTDGGRTWGDRVPIADGTVEERSYSHGVPVQREDGSLFMTLWAAEPQLQSYYGLYTVHAFDDGARTWSTPAPTGIPGQTSCVVDMGGDRLLVIYSHRDDPEQPGIKVIASDDGGVTWPLDEPLVVWDAYGKEALGVPRTATYPSSHDIIAYGAPRIMRLDDDHALAHFWCTQAGDTHCRFAKIRLGEET